MIPTKIIEKDEFTRLQNEEGDVLIVHKLTNIPFTPPLPEGLPEVKVKRAAINILLLNVTEPVIYKDKSDGTVYVILNGYDDDTYTYENFCDVHYIKDAVNAWGYRLAPGYWDEDDEDDDLDIPVFVFRHESREGQGLDEV